MADPIPVDRAGIFAAICHRNGIRRDAQLPLLNIRAEYRCLVNVAKWNFVVERYYSTTRAEIIAGMRAEYGNGWGYSAGGRWATEILTTRLLRERYWH